MDWGVVDCPDEPAQEPCAVAPLGPPLPPDAPPPEAPPDEPMENAPRMPGFKMADGEHGC